MTRSPIKTKLMHALRKARTKEPYPVWVHWAALAQSVYGHSSDRAIMNLRRVASATYGVMLVRYGNGKHAGAQLTTTPEEAWLERWVLKSAGRGNYSAASHGYMAPSPDEILTGFARGLAQRHVYVDVAKLAVIVNEYCDAGLDPSEVAWSRVEYERDWEVNRKALLQRIAVSLRNHRAALEEAEIERRAVTVGPFRIDPLDKHGRCPCCLQAVPAGFPKQHLHRGTATSQPPAASHAP